METEKTDYYNEKALLFRTIRRIIKAIVWIIAISAVMGILGVMLSN